MRHAITQDQASLPHAPAECLIVEHEGASPATDPASMVVLDTGEMCAITSWFDSNGHDCDPSEAEFTIVGPCSDGSWHTIELGQYSNHRMQ